MKKLKVIFLSVLTNQYILVVQLPDDNEVMIRPKPHLKPLPNLKKDIFHEVGRRQF